MSNDNTNNEALLAQIAQLQAENDRLKAGKAPKTSLKVSAKGGVSLYGLGRWPVTLYASQWEALLAKADTIKAFIAEHRKELAVKGEETTIQNA